MGIEEGAVTFAGSREEGAKGVNVAMRVARW
jgi:hypothetical protein